MTQQEKNFIGDEIIVEKESETEENNFQTSNQQDKVDVVPGTYAAKMN